MGRSRSRSRDRRRHGRSRTRSRDRSRDRDRKRHRGHDHKHSSRSNRRSSPGRSKDTQKGIDAAKSRMRSALESAHAQMNDVKIEVDSAKQTTTYAVSRHRDIERIAEGEFRSSFFTSTSGGAGGRVKKEDPKDREAAVGKKQDSHDKAMFGPKWRDPVAKTAANEEEQGEDLISNRKDIDLANPRLSADPAEREQRWLKKFRERRAALLCL